jgi:serine/threonine protein kinase
MGEISATMGEGSKIRIPMSFRRYQYVKMIGKGCYSVVILVRVRGIDSLFACKICSRQVLIKEGLFARFEREVRVLETISHPNIVQLFEVVYERDLIYLIMEYCPYGELFNAISDSGPLGEDVCHWIFPQIVDALLYLHTRGIAHRDIKPENILFDEYWNPKIADLGACQHTRADSLMQTFCGTIYYLPPEIINGRQYDGRASDVWCLGIVLYVMFVGEIPWSAHSDPMILRQICKGEFVIPSTIPECVLPLLGQMLSPDPADRPTMAEIASHPWVMSGAKELPLLRPQSQRRYSDSRLRKPVPVKRPAPLIVQGAIAHGAFLARWNHAMNRIPAIHKFSSPPVL